jgi:hypothetical protein
MRGAFPASVLAAALLVLPAQAEQSDFAGVWEQYPGLGNELDPSLPLPPVPLHKTEPPLKAEFEESYRAMLKIQADAEKAGKPVRKADDTCMPYGMPTMMQAAFPIEFLFTPGRVTIISEAFNEVRRVYLDEQQVNAESTEPTFGGHSVGRWEGDVLVIDTTAVKDYVRMRQAPHSIGMRIVERISLVSKNMLRNEITVTDPQYLTKPWTFGWAYRRIDYRLSEYVCEDNREYEDETGAIKFKFAD